MNAEDIVVKPATEYEPVDVLKAYARHGSKVRAAQEAFDVDHGSARFNRAWKQCRERGWVEPRTPTSQWYVLTSEGVRFLREETDVKVVVTDDGIRIE